MIFPLPIEIDRRFFGPIITPASRLRRDKLSWPWSSGLLCDGRPLEGRLVHRWRGEVVVKSERTFGGLLTIGIKFYLCIVELSWFPRRVETPSTEYDRVNSGMQRMKFRFVENPSISPPISAIGSSDQDGSTSSLSRLLGQQPAPSTDSCHDVSWPMRRNRPCPQLRCGVSFEGSFLSFRSFWSKNWEFGILSVLSVILLLDWNWLICLIATAAVAKPLECQWAGDADVADSGAMDGPPLLNCVKWLQRRTLCWRFSWHTWARKMGKSTVHDLG